MFQRHLQLFLSSCDWVFKKPIRSGLVNMVRGVRKEKPYRKCRQWQIPHSPPGHVEKAVHCFNYWIFLFISGAEFLTCCHAHLRQQSHSEASLTLFEELIVNKNLCLCLTGLSIDQDEHREESGHPASAGVYCLVKILASCGTQVAMYCHTGKTCIIAFNTTLWAGLPGVQIISFNLNTTQANRSAYTMKTWGSSILMTNASTTNVLLANSKLPFVWNECVCDALWWIHPIQTVYSQLARLKFIHLADCGAQYLYYMLMLRFRQTSWFSGNSGLWWSRSITPCIHI